MRQLSDGSLRRPSVVKTARIVPYPAGWMAQTDRGVVTLRSRGFSDAARDEILELLDGTRSVRTLAEQVRAPRAAVEAFVQRLARLHLLGTPVRDGDSRAAAPEPAPRRGPSRPLLLVGGNPLAGTMLGKLRSSGFSNVHLLEGWHTIGEQLLRKRLTDVIRKVDLAVCCMDRPSVLPVFMAELCGSSGVTLVIVRLTETGGILGPTNDGSGLAGGCGVCASLYEANRDAFAWHLRRYLLRRSPRLLNWSYPPGPATLDVLTDLALLASMGALNGRPHTREAESPAWVVTSPPLEVRACAIPKHYGCVRCFPSRGGTPAKLRRSAERSWRQTYEAEIGRCLALEEIWHLKPSLVAPEYGVFRSCEHDSPAQRRRLYRSFNERGVNPKTSLTANSYGAVATRFVHAAARTVSVHSEGLDFENPRKAEALALVDGLERLFALDYCHSGRIVTARYCDMAAEALDPREFPLYSENQYRDRRFEMRRFDPKAPIRWLWGIRATDSRPILVPMDLVYGTASRDSLYLANSSGAACHSSFHHAVLGGIYETIERDSLMTVWMHRLSMPVVRPTGDDGDLPIRRELEALGFKITYVDVTTDVGVPVLLAIFEDRSNPDFYLVTTAASLGHRKMLDQAHRDFVQLCRPYLRDPRHYIRAATAESDPACVRAFPDHVAFYQNVKKRGHVRFLSAGATGDWFDATPPPAADVKCETELIVRRLHAAGYDVIVVDCTTPFVANLGLHAVKVLIPGLQPLHSGYRYAPSGRRLLERPRLMGLAARDRKLEELNPWPHPF